MGKDKGLGIPSDRLLKRTFAIVNDRDRYFNDMIRKFKEKYSPALKIIYANNTMGAQLNPNSPTPDFVIVIKGTLVSKKKTLPPRPIIMVDIPMIFSDRSLAGWTISVEQGRMDEYFQYMLDDALRIDESKFYEYITHMALLSTDPEDPRYWKRIENTPGLTKDLEELYARYNRKGKTKLDQERGY